MNVSDISFQCIQIQAPSSTEEQYYRFPIQYGMETPGSFTFHSINPYILRIQKDTCHLHIKDRNDLKFFNHIYHSLTDGLYEKHEAWFENKFERTRYDHMFKNYLYPNIEENAVNIHCTITAELLTKYKDTTDLTILPTFHLKSIIFNHVSFYIELELIHLEPIVKTPNTDKEEKHDHEESILQEEEKEECELEQEQQQEDNQFEENSETKTYDEQVPTKLPEMTEIEEVYIAPDELEETSFQLNDEDYFILFKIIQSNIKENFSESLINIFNEKQIETKNINIQDIVYDSDENEDSEDEILKDDDFEDNYNQLV